MHTLRLGRAVLVCGLWLLAACSSGAFGVAPAGATEKSNTRSSPGAVSCKTDSECPSGQRCGFTGAKGCEEIGKCVVENKNTNCFDPGGRCGCDGRPVDLFCGKGSSSEFASRPVGSVGPCPRPCTDDQGCPSHLACQHGVCGLPQGGGQETKPRDK
jgi:hypothetical protein